MTHEDVQEMIDHAIRELLTDIIRSAETAIKRTQDDAFKIFLKELQSWRRSL